METIEFIIPTYWEIWDILSQLEWRLIVFAGVVFCVGFLMRRIWGRRLISEKRMEIQELRKRLQGAENLLEEERRSKPKEEIDTESMGEDISPVTISHGEIDDPDIMDELYSQEGLEPAELWEMYHKAEHRKVIVTKVIGPRNSGPTFRTPLSGIEVAPPVVGKPYQVQLKEGTLLRTTVVTKLSKGHIQTENSVYRVEVLNRGGDFNQRNQTDE